MAAQSSPWYRDEMSSATTAAVPPRRGPGRPRAGEQIADRDELLAAAMRVIRTDGPDVTMDDIAAAAGVSKPIVYRNLGDKDALVVALSEIFVERLTEVHEASAAPGADRCVGRVDHGQDSRTSERVASGP